MLLVVLCSYKIHVPYINAFLPFIILCTININAAQQTATTIW